MSFVFSGELEVEGDLKVTGTIENDLLQQEIAQLNATIAALQIQINLIQSQLGMEDCNGDGIIDDSDDFPCGFISDVDGNLYELIQIGDQRWFSENLKVTHYNNGDPMNTNLSNSAWSSTNEGAYVSPYPSYGYHYNWYAVDDERGICPEGWHVSTDSDWMTLEMTIGLSYEESESLGWRGSNEGGKLKALTTWWDPNSYATDEYNFSAIPAGEVTGAGQTVNSGGWTWFWTTTEANDGAVYWRELGYNLGEIRREYTYGKNDGKSVRCLED